MNLASPKKLTPVTKALAISIISAALSANVQQLRDKVLPLVNHHPVLAFTVGAVCSLLLLLQQPAVQSAVREAIANEEPQGATPNAPAPSN